MTNLLDGVTIKEHAKKMDHFQEITFHKMFSSTVNEVLKECLDTMVDGHPVVNFDQFVMMAIDHYRKSEKWQKMKVERVERTKEDRTYGKQVWEAIHNAVDDFKEDDENPTKGIYWYSAFEGEVLYGVEDNPNYMIQIVPPEILHQWIVEAKEDSENDEDWEIYEAIAENVFDAFDEFRCKVLDNEEEE
jgi:hypothetical protein